MITRSAIEWLNNWKTRENRKPLVIRGARQVGKSTLVKEFGKQFDNFLAFNLDVREDLSIFSKEMSAGDLFDVMLALRNKTKNSGSTLIFIDEIQNSPAAVRSLRYFYEELPHIHVIAAGSLLETLLDERISFPVGRVEYMALRPCSFREFLGALEEDSLCKYLVVKDMPIPIHGKLISLFYKYVLVGGMPEAVANFAQNRDLVSLDSIFESLMAGYIDDVEKYASRQSSRELIRFVISNCWSFASSRITFEHFGKSNYKSREVGEAFRTLQKAMLLELVYPTSEVEQPISQNLNKKPKLMLLDTGLVNYASGTRSEIIKEQINDSWRGKVSEHIVGQELISASRSVLDRRSFWVRESKNAQAEVDFLFNSRSHGLIPVEVKSGDNSHLRSLQMFMKESSAKIAVRFWDKPFSQDTIRLASGKEYELYNLPYYMAGSLEGFLANV